MTFESFVSACQHGYLGTVNDFLKDTAIYAIAEDYGNVALRLAALNGHLDVVIRLLEIPAVLASATACDNGALIGTAKSNQLAVMNRLLEIPAVVEAAAADNNLALVSASVFGYFDVVKRLLEIPAVVEAEMRNGNAALKKAVLFDRHEVVNLLLQEPAILAMACAQLLTDVFQDKKDIIRQAVAQAIDFKIKQIAIINATFPQPIAEVVVDEFFYVVSPVLPSQIKVHNLDEALNSEHTELFLGKDALKRKN